jgi:small-conductance mechanosensitive channel
MSLKISTLSGTFRGMNQLVDKLNLALPALAMIAIGFLAGVIMERIIFVRLTKAVGKTKWEGGNIIISSIHGMVLLWCVIAGAHAALYNLSLAVTLFNFLQKSLVILTIFTATIVVARIVVGFINLYSRGAAGILPSISISSNISKLVIYIIGLMIALQTLGISVAPILTALGVGGLAVALALRDTLANLFAGLHILLSQQLKQGDYIKMQTGEEGYVTDITWRNTSIRTLADNLIIVPNANLAAASITNFHLPAVDVPVRVEVGVSYASDLEHVERTTLAVASELAAEMGHPDFAPVLRYHTFGDSSINFTVIMRAKAFADQYLVTHEFIKRLHRSFHAEGIEIPFPIRTVQVKKVV